MKLLLGPLLGVEADSAYTICFVTPRACERAEVFLSGQPITATLIQTLHFGKFWRADVELPAKALGHVVKYSLSADDRVIADHNNIAAWSFYIPAKDEAPEFVYTSCNGFSSASLAAGTNNPYCLWQRIKTEQDERITHFNDADMSSPPYSMLLMGGDQLYADSIWDDVAELKKWCNKSAEDRMAKKASKLLTSQISKFYEKLYYERWNQPETALMLASIPNVMMWDDHDIFDGWGSYPAEIQNGDVHQTIFAQAKQYFELFQMRSSNNQSLINKTNQHYSFCFKYRQTHILALDNRSERTIKQVMSPNQWAEILQHLDKIEQGNLLVLSAVPVVYRDFSAVETYFDTTPWEEELSDDLKDHWRAKEHQGERMRLIQRLLANARKRVGAKSVILSGDVHVGCLGVITDKTDAQVVKLHQVVASGIVHPAPSRLAWLGITTSTNDRDESLNEDNTIISRMLTPIHADKYIRSRNYATLAMGSDKKLWINWQTENTDKPVYPID